MPKIFFLVLFSAAVLLSANPMVPRAIQQFWFDDSGDLMLQFGNEIMALPSQGVTISDGTNTVNYMLDLPDGDQGLPLTINLSALMPDLASARKPAFCS